MPLRPCIECGRTSDQARCPAHRRGTTAERGYDADHQRERAAWAPAVAAGQIDCRRGPDCVAPTLRIQPGEPWHLGHPDAQCPAPKAPEHVVCNAGAPRRDA